MEPPIQPQGSTWYRARNRAFRLNTTWALLCIVALVTDAVVSIDAKCTGWLPLPWSAMDDFVETADGIIIDLSFFARVLRLDSSDDPVLVKPVAIPLPPTLGWPSFVVFVWLAQPRRMRAAQKSELDKAQRLRFVAVVRGRMER